MTDGTVGLPQSSWVIPAPWIQMPALPEEQESRHLTLPESNWETLGCRELCDQRSHKEEQARVRGGGCS